MGNYEFKTIAECIQKMLHNDIKKQLDFTIEDWNNDRETGWLFLWMTLKIFLDVLQKWFKHYNGI